MGQYLTAKVFSYMFAAVALASFTFGGVYYVKSLKRDADVSRLEATVAIKDVQIADIGNALNVCLSTAERWESIANTQSEAIQRLQQEGIDRTREAEQRILDLQGNLGKMEEYVTSLLNRPLFSTAAEANAAAIDAMREPPFKIEKAFIQ